MFRAEFVKCLGYSALLFFFSVILIPFRTLFPWSKVELRKRRYDAQPEVWSRVQRRERLQVTRYHCENVWVAKRSSAQWIGNTRLAIRASWPPQHRFPDGRRRYTRGDEEYTGAWYQLFPPICQIGQAQDCDRHCRKRHRTVETKWMRWRLVMKSSNRTGRYCQESQAGVLCGTLVLTQIKRIETKILRIKYFLNLNLRDFVTPLLFPRLRQKLRAAKLHHKVFSLP